MNTNNKNIQKRNYSSPKIEEVKLDHEISLVLESPPTGPRWEGVVLNTHEHFNNDPLKTQLS